MSETDKTPLMLSLRDASKLYGLSYTALRVMCIQEIIPSVRIGRKIFVNSDLLTSYLGGAHYINLNEEK